MNKIILFLSLLMGVIVLASNYLVQFPINYYGLSEILTYGAFTYPIASSHKSLVRVFESEK